MKYDWPQVVFGREITKEDQGPNLTLHLNGVELSIQNQWAFKMEVHENPTGITIVFIVFICGRHYSVFLMKELKTYNCLTLLNSWGGFFLLLGFNYKRSKQKTVKICLKRSVFGSLLSCIYNHMILTHLSFASPDLLYRMFSTWRGKNQISGDLVYLLCSQNCKTPPTSLLTIPQLGFKYAAQHQGRMLFFASADQWLAYNSCVKVPIPFLKFRLEIQ